MKAGAQFTIDLEEPLESVFEPVSSQTAIQQTLARLETAIKLGLLPPGSRLPAERELCLRLGISRSTLRQALTAMARRGQLRAVRGRGGGTFVADDPPTAPPVPDQVVESWRDICDQRMAVELGVAALAAERAKPADTGPLRDLLDQMAQTQDSERSTYGALDRRFHILVAKMTGSRPLLSMSVRLQGSVSDLLSVLPELRIPRATIEEQHETLVDAIETGDGERSIRIMADHLHLIEKALADGLPEIRGTSRFQRSS